MRHCANVLLSIAKKLFVRAKPQLRRDQSGASLGPAARAGRMSGKGQTLPFRASAGNVRSSKTGHSRCVKRALAPQ